MSRMQTAVRENPKDATYTRRRPLILINGLAEQPESWYRNVPSWRQHFDVHQPALLVYDGIALQRRIAADQPITVDYLVEQLRTYVDSYIQQDQCYLAANSMGGKVAVEFAIRYPELVERLVLLCPSGLARQEVLPIVAGVRRSDLSSMVESVFHDTQYIESGLVEFFKRQFQDRRWRTGLLRTIRGTMDHSVRERLSLVTQPTLVVVGKEDRIVDPRETLEATQNLRNRQVIQLSNCGHAPQIEMVDVVNQLVIDFLT